MYQGGVLNDKVVSGPRHGQVDLSGCIQNLGSDTTLSFRRCIWKSFRISHILLSERQIVFSTNHSH